MLSDLPSRPGQPASPPIVQVEREARELLHVLAAAGEPLPDAPAFHGRPLLYAAPAPPEPEPEEADQ